MDRRPWAVIQEWQEAAKNLLFPPRCVVCESSASAMAGGICSDCLATVAVIGTPLCVVCGKELASSAAGDHCCGLCLRNKPSYSSVRGVAHYQEPTASLLHHLKYQGELSVLPALEKIIGLSVATRLGEEDRVVPVPLHLRRLRERGFNQALLLAELFFPEQKEQILVDTLQRTRYTTPQTELDGAGRRKNMRKAFRVENGDEIKGRTIFLVDDVYTTGSTVGECSRVLFAAGASEVHVLTVARVRG